MSTNYFTCTFCNVGSFKSFNLLRDHEIAHHCIFDCVFCKNGKRTKIVGKYLTMSGTFENHVSREHPSVDFVEMKREYYKICALANSYTECPICKQYVHKNSIELHIEVHLSCEECEKCGEMIKKELMKEHENYHFKQDLMASIGDELSEEEKAEIMGVDKDGDSMMTGVTDDFSQLQINSGRTLTEQFGGLTIQDEDQNMLEVDGLIAQYAGLAF